MTTQAVTDTPKDLPRNGMDSMKGDQKMTTPIKYTAKTRVPKHFNENRSRLARFTLSAVKELTGKAFFDYLDHEVEVPQVSKQAAQGDVLILRVTTKPATTLMPKTVVVVASEASANTHTLHPSGDCFWDATPNAGLVQGKLTVPDGSSAVLSHQEHGAFEILPGTYELRRQREWGSEWRQVHD
ncbi:hypothetical protein [Mycobacteroides abscessus]|uniref:hypothetical protein n=1 Tax=Mycobacteroides abscessus TaxID=36809 RepID=UPI0012FFF2D4|nr:hypothetical protein [Mycobacteroides abscessus]